MQTTATLDVASDEWVVNTPDEGAIKVHSTLSVPSSRTQSACIHAHLA